MGKDFLKLTYNTKHLSRLVFVIGTVITIGLGIKSVRDANIQTDYEITCHRRVKEFLKKN